MTIMDRVGREYRGMSRAQRRIVHYLMKDQKALLFDSLASFSKKAGSSEATVVRFAHLLGYSGYTDLQDHMRAELLDNIEKADASQPEPSLGHFVHETDGACQRVKSTIAKLDFENFCNACAVLMEAENIIVVGYLDSFGVAAQLFHLLDDVHPFVDFTRLLADAYEINRRIHKKAALMVVSFAPHYRYTYDLVRRAAEVRCPVVLMCDSLLNPLTEYAEHVLLVDVFHDEKSKCIDVMPALHIAHLMVRHITHNFPEKVAEHQRTTLKRFEEYLD